MNLELIEKNKMELNKGEKYIVITQPLIENSTFRLGYGIFRDIFKQHASCHPYRHVFEQYSIVNCVVDCMTNCVDLHYSKSRRYTTPTLFIDNIYTIDVNGIPNEILCKIMSYL